MYSEAGSPHNGLCFSCREAKADGLLIGCNTCCRSYHPICLPSEPQLSQLWYCPGCLEREWHIATPNDSARPRTETVKEQSKSTACSPPSDLPKWVGTPSAVQTIGRSIAVSADCNTSGGDIEQMDASEKTSPTQEGMEDALTGIQGLPMFPDEKILRNR